MYHLNLLPRGATVLLLQSSFGVSSMDLSFQAQAMPFGIRSTSRFLDKCGQRLGEVLWFKRLLPAGHVFVGVRHCLLIIASREHERHAMLSQSIRDRQERGALPSVRDRKL